MMALTIAPNFSEKTFPPMLTVWRLQTDLFPAAREKTCRSLGSSHICSFSSAQVRRAALSKSFLMFISSLLLCLWVKKLFNCLHTFHLKFQTLSRCLICRFCPGAKTARLTKSASTMINRLFSKLFQAAYL